MCVCVSLGGRVKNWYLSLKDSEGGVSQRLKYKKKKQKKKKRAFRNKAIRNFPLPYLSTFRNFHGGDSARIDVFDPFFLRLSTLGKSLGISMGETFFLTYKQAKT